MEVKSYVPAAGHDLMRRLYDPLARIPEPFVAGRMLRAALH